MGLSLGSILGGIGAIAGGPWGAALGGLGGILGASNAASGNRKRMRNAEQLQAEMLQMEREKFAKLLPLFDEQLSGMKRTNRLGGVIAQMAEGYNPRRETTEAVAFASKAAQSALQSGLQNLNAGLRSNGMIPNRSTEYKVNSNAIANDALGPLQEFAANRASGDFSRKIAMLQAASGVPLGQVGDIFGSYSNALSNAARNSMGMMQPVPDSSGSLALLGEALNGILKPRSGGANTSSPRGGGGGGNLMEILGLLMGGTPGIQGSYL